MLVALFSGGHILLEGPPGTAKTLLAHSFAEAVGLKFGRIQFTPDLMPGDIIGANLFNFQTSTFSLTRRPISTEMLLAEDRTSIVLGKRGSVRDDLGGSRLISTNYQQPTTS